MDCHSSEGLYDVSWMAETNPWRRHAFHSHPARRGFPPMTGFGPNMSNYGQCCALSLSVGLSQLLDFVGV